MERRFARSFSFSVVRYRGLCLRLQLFFRYKSHRVLTMARVAMGTYSTAFSFTPSDHRSSLWIPIWWAMVLDNVEWLYIGSTRRRKSGDLSDSVSFSPYGQNCSKFHASRKSWATFRTFCIHGKYSGFYRASIRTFLSRWGSTVARSRYKRFRFNGLSLFIASECSFHLEQISFIPW